MLEFKDFIEILSDVLGAVGAGVLVLPTYRLLTDRRALHEKRQQLISRLNGTNPPKVDDLLVELSEADAASGSYNPTDTIWVMLGIGLIGAAFVLKLLYHGLSKF